jgi:hypothetical protein
MTIPSLRQWLVSCGSNTLRDGENNFLGAKHHPFH